MGREIMISDDYCWHCGGKFNNNRKKTMHHCIPKFQCPHTNVVVPVCEDCHEKKINQHNAKQIIAFSFKVMRCCEDMRNMVTNWYDTLNGYLRQKVDYEKSLEGDCRGRRS